MKIVTTCYHCGKETTIETPRWVRTIVDFEMEKKASFFHTCDRCRKNNKSTVHQVHAKKDYFGFFLFSIGFTAIVIILTQLLESYIPLVLFIFLPLMWGDEKDNVKGFNKSKEKMLKRKKVM